MQLFDEYIVNCETAVKRTPKDPHAWAELGQALQSRDVRWHEGGKLQPRALEAYEKCLSLKPSVELHIMVGQKKGVLLGTMGRIVESLESYERVLEIAHNDEDIATAYYHKGLAYQTLGRLREAYQALRASLQSKPSYLISYLPLVQTLAELNQTSKEQWVAIMDEIQSAIRAVDPTVSHRLSPTVSAQRSRRRSTSSSSTSNGGGASSVPTGISDKVAVHAESHSTSTPLKRYY